MRRSPRFPFQDCRGLTVLELLVASLIVGVLLAASLPSLSSTLNAHQLQSALRETTSYIRLIRATAVARNLPARLVVGDGGSRLSIEVQSGGTWQAVGSPLVLDHVIVFSVTPVTGLQFSAQGTTTASSTLTLRNSTGGTRAINVSILGSVEIAS